jgi:hypothetical protein
MSMKRGDYYFANSVLGGVGRMFFLKIPQNASMGSDPARLIGSLVEEGDDGLLGGKEWPVPENSFILGAVLSIMMNDFGVSSDDATNTLKLAGVSQRLKIDKQIGGSLTAPFPGVPASLGVSVDYKKLVDIVIELGAGAEKHLIPRDLLKSTYQGMAKNSGKYHPALFDNDRMVIDQVLLVRKLALTVTSEKEFSVGFEAQADAINNLKAGVTYKKVTEKSFNVSIDSPDPFLLAVGGVEADKFIR